MAYIDNSDTKKEINDAIRGNAVSNIAPTQVNNSIQPVINVNPKDYRRANIVRSITSAATGTIIAYTTPTDKDFFLTGFNVCVNHSAASDGTSNYLNVTIDGASQILCAFRKTALTAFDQVLSQNFSTPIKIDRGTSINLTGTFTVGVSCKTLQIQGYTVEP